MPSYSRERLLAKVLTDDNGCWIWQGQVHKETGYGRVDVKVNNTWKTWRAHRLAYIVLVGAIPDGLIVCHRCDVRACVNPEHLFLGTDRDNSYDCIDKGRQRTICQPKLTTEQVAAIRQSTESQRTLGARFGVRYQTIGKIKRGSRWRRAS